MFSINTLFRRKHDIVPETLWALRNKLPASLDVAITRSEDGGYVASINNLPGCFTEGSSFEELNEMLNTAVYDYFSVPAEYFPYIQSYNLPKEVVMAMEARSEELPRKEQRLVFSRV